MRMLTRSAVFRFGPSWLVYVNDNDYLIIEIFTGHDDMQHDIIMPPSCPNTLEPLSYMHPLDDDEMVDCKGEFAFSY